MGYRIVGSEVSMYAYCSEIPEQVMVQNNLFLNFLTYSQIIIYIIKKGPLMIFTYGEHIILLSLTLL